MGHLGADEHGVDLVVEVEVADVLGGAEQQLGVFSAEHAGAKDRTSHEPHAIRG